MPLNFYSICSEVNDIGKADGCSLIEGWHINNQGMIDSGVVLKGQKL